MRRVIIIVCAGVLGLPGQEVRADADKLRSRNRCVLVEQRTPSRHLLSHCATLALAANEPAIGLSRVGSSLPTRWSVYRRHLTAPRGVIACRKGLACQRRERRRHATSHEAVVACQGDRRNLQRGGELPIHGYRVTAKFNRTPGTPLPEGRAPSVDWISYDGVVCWVRLANVRGWPRTIRVTQNDVVAGVKDLANPDAE